MRTKRAIFVAIFLFAFQPLSAQKIYYVNEKISYLPQKYDCAPEHEIRAGVGAFPVIPNEFWGSYDYFSRNRWNWEIVPVGYITTGAITISYSYRFKTWLELGGVVSYWGIYGKPDKFSPTERNSNFHSIFVMPTIRFAYFTNDYVRIYAGFSVGYGVVINNDEKTHPRAHAEFAYSGNVVLFGITAGKRLFGYSEISYGSLGFVTVGIGYRFFK